MRSRLSLPHVASVILALGATAHAADDVWVEDVKTPLELRDEHGDALLRYTLARLSDPNGQIDIRLPESLVKDADPRVVVVSYTGGSMTATTRVGSARGILAAIDAAVRTGPRVAAEHTRWTKLDVVRSSRPAESRWRGDTLDIKHGEGIALPRSGNAKRVALPWEVIAAEGIVSDDMRFDPHALRPSLTGATADVGDGLQPVLLYTVDAFYTDGTRTRRTRHDRWLQAGSATQEDFDLSIKLAGDYLKRSVGPDGKFIYQYGAAPAVATEIAGDDAAPAAADYNIVRHAGALLSLVYVYEAEGKRDEQARAAMERAVRYLLAQAKPVRNLPDADLIVEADKGKLGANGLGLNAVAHYTKATGDRQFVPAMKRLANWLVATQNTEGKFTIHVQRFSDGAVLKTSSPYATGEAIWGLCTLHDIDPDNGRWLDAGRRAMDYMVTTRDPKITDELKYQDHWLLYALDNLGSRRVSEPLWEGHARRMVETIMRTQVKPNLEHPEWEGAYTRPPNANQTATRVEGLCAGYRLLNPGEKWQRGQGSELIKTSIEAGTRFQLRQQFLIPEAMYTAEPKEILGGFRNSPSDARVRIDTVQHNVVALMDAGKILFAK